ncbi:hypothetical protein [Streptomyces amakusaensis]|uniref:Secreted protein n=1 Tax=Streptomyces amakusaensis TaxID=67271 RepID=A0ABW0AVZ5_9ACTN
MGIGMLVAGTAAPLAVYIGVDEYQERADRRAVESAARAVVQERVSYAERAREGRKAAAGGRGPSSAETRLFAVDVDFFADDFARIDFSQETDFAREGRAAENSEEIPPTVSSHSFSFRKVDGEWLLSRDHGPDEFA